MKKYVLIALLVLLLMLTACSSPEADAPKSMQDVSHEDRLHCVTDDDCVCGGIDEASGSCFIGNRDYYEKHVDTSKQCPDFCTGISGSLVVRCIDNKCMQVMECLTDLDCDSGVCEGNKCVEREAGSECSSDSDCRTGGCSGELCTPTSQEERATICEFRPEYECFSMIDCGCVNGRCRWKETAEYKGCVEDAKSQ